MTRKVRTWLVGGALVLAFSAGCSSPSERSASVTTINAAQPQAPHGMPRQEVSRATVPAGVAQHVERAAAGSPAPRAAVARSHSVNEAPRASALKVKRFVVASGVKDREPIAGEGALVADGSAIFAFAELANDDGGSENVRITFERKGGAERVGNVTLPVPGQVARHRTWAMTRFIRAAGVWDAVLWTESGQELGRTSFEVTAS